MAAATGPSPKKKDESFEPTSELGRELRAMYGDDAGATEDLSVIERAPHSLGKKILIGLIVFFGILAAASWAGFFFFAGNDAKFSGDRIDLAIEGPFAPVGGETVTYEFTWKNGERVPLGTAELDVRMPKEFSVSSFEPAADKPSWTLGTIGSGKSGSVKVTGVFLAPVGKEMDMQAILTYRPADFNSEFQKVTTRTVALGESALRVAVTGPAKVLPGDKAAFELAYENTSAANAFGDVRLVAEYPRGFIPETAEPEADDQQRTTWSIPSLLPGQKGTVNVTGTFASDVAGAAEIKARIGFLGAEDDFLLQHEAALTAEVLQGDLVAALILNGKAEDQPVNFGDTLRYALTFKNTGEAALGDVELSVVLDAEPSAALISWNGLIDRQEGVRDGNRITWTKKQISALENVEAGEEGTVEFSVPIASTPLAGASTNDYRVTSRLEARIGSLDGEPSGRVTKSQLIVAKVNSDAALASGARYFSEDNIPLGSGPLPPTVGQQTVYRAEWTVTNSFHELTDLKISTRLPDNVIWTGKSAVDAGEIAFDPADGKITWSLNWLPTSITSLAGSFDLAITPTESQVGKVVPLTEAVLFEAKDRVTGAAILLSAPPLTTAVESDEFAAGQGRVQAAP